MLRKIVSDTRNVSIIHYWHGNFIIYNKFLLMFKRKFSYSFLFASSLFVLSGCGGNSGSQIKNPADNSSAADTSMAATVLPKPDWGSDIRPEMLEVINKLSSYGALPLESLSATEARKQPTPTTAVMALLKEKNITIPASQVDTMSRLIPVTGGAVAARIYTPKSGNGPFPVIVYYHGGGWVIADLNTYDASARGLAEQVGAIVVSVHYRQGPEHLFPTAHQDAFAAYQWTLKNAASLKGDPAKIAVVGESAGGNLAANVSIQARDKKTMLPLYQALIYPVANNDMNSESYIKYAQAKPLNKPMMGWFVKNYLGDTLKSSDPRISLVKANLKGLPPTTIIAAEIDPLLTEGKLLAERLQEAGIAVNYKRYDGVTHEFFGMALFVPEAKDAQGVVAADLKKAFHL